MPDVGKGAREIRTRTKDVAYRVFYVVENANGVRTSCIPEDDTEDVQG